MEFIMKQLYLSEKTEHTFRPNQKMVLIIQEGALV